MLQLHPVCQRMCLSNDQEQTFYRNRGELVTHLNFQRVIDIYFFFYSIVSINLRASYLRIDYRPDSKANTFVASLRRNVLT